jgi:DNA-3-methyladenine glycosylase I
MDDLVTATDGIMRCGWAAGDPLYLAYHDGEWGHSLRGDDALFELLTLEAFQAGLAWITILRKRQGFRDAFGGFRIETVAGYGEPEVERLVADARIIRHRGKIEATIGNACAALALDAGLDAFVWDFAPAARKRRPRSLAELPAETDESRALSKALKRRGFRFVGPTTAYAFMQAAGLVDDHLEGCETHP